MVCLGYKDTLSVTMDDMLHHTKAVARGVKNAPLVSNMPFMSYQASIYDAVKNAERFIQEAAARCVQPGDKIIIMTYCQINKEEARAFKPTVIFVDDTNIIKKITNYEIHAEIK